MKSLLTPKEVGVSLRVSESSVKRWCDKGLIATQYTAGGHRRIPTTAFIDFLKQSGRELVRPEVVGLPDGLRASAQLDGKTAEEFAECLLRGEEDHCRRVLLGLWLAGHGVSALCDDLVAPSLKVIGERWAEGATPIYQERRACEITMRGLHELRLLMRRPASRASLAFGATPEGDQFGLATAMVELVLRDLEWDAVSLGTNLPFSTLHTAIEENRPRLFWLSCSHIPNQAEFLREYGELYERFGGETAFVVGGRALSDELRKQMKYAAYCDNMRHLASFAANLPVGDLPERPCRDV
jgi:methanogenic corrinoid protein MtbC1